MGFLSHFDTIVPAKLARKPSIPLIREEWATSDNDRIAVDHTSLNSHQPRVILFHGLEGSSQSHYAKYLAAACTSKQLAVTFPHFRTCGELENRLPRAYHAGDWQEIGEVIQAVQQRFQPSALYVVGVSLGGNALLHWLGKCTNDAHSLVTGAVAVSAPIDLTQAGDALNVGWNKRLYGDYFLSSLKPKALRLIEQFPALSDRLNVSAIQAARTIREFDEYFTAPVHGFESVAHYWQTASSLPYLKQITVPTLILNAKNDPFVPADSLPRPNDLSASITCHYPPRGGHVGWHTGFPWAKKNNQLADIILNYLFSIHDR